MTKYKTKQMGHFINIVFSVAAILFCVFLVAIKFAADLEDDLLLTTLVAGSLFALLVGNILFSIEKLRYLSTIKHKFVAGEHS